MRLIQRRKAPHAAAGRRGRQQRANTVTTSSPISSIVVSSGVSRGTSLGAMFPIAAFDFVRKFSGRPYHGHLIDRGSGQLCYGSGSGLQGELDAPDT